MNNWQRRFEQAKAATDRARQKKWDEIREKRERVEKKDESSKDKK